MKRSFSLFLILLSMSCLLPIAFAQEEEPVAEEQNAEAWMPDATLRTAVRLRLGLAEDEALTQERMLELTTLKVESMDPTAVLSDLSGLEHATNLTRLDILDLMSETFDRSRIRLNLAPIADLINLTRVRLYYYDFDLTPLSGLTNLTWLDLWYNAIEDVSPLSGLTNLTRLRLTDNAIADVTPLAGLTNLTWLHLADNAIEDVSALSGLTNLTELYLSNNAIEDVSALSGLTNLTELYLSNNAIEDIGPLAGLGNLQTFEFRGNPLLPFTLIPDSGLAAAVQNALGLVSKHLITTEAVQGLELLKARASNISDLTGLEHATNLIELDVADNQISDLTPIAQLTNLMVLDLADNSVASLTPLAQLTQLEALYLSGNYSFFDASPLAGLVNLETLTLAGTRIDDTSPLEGLTAALDIVLFADSNLRFAVALHLKRRGDAIISIETIQTLTRLGPDFSSDITDLTGLEQAINLTQLDFSENNISDLTPLAGLTLLEHLNLTDNQITDVSPLAGLVNLQTLQLTGNSIPIENTRPIARLTAEIDIPVVEMVFLEGMDVNLAAVIRTTLGLPPGVPLITQDIERLTELDANSSQITDLTGLEHATDLLGLNLSDNSITDLSPLTGLGDLTKLYLVNNNISNVNPLANLVNLTDLRLAGNDIADTDPLGSLTTQIDIDVPGIEFPDANLAAAIRTDLGLAPNAIAITTTAIRTLTRISAWSLDISDLTGLEHAINLGQLAVQDNSIEDLTPIAGLINLDKLWLHGNNISDLTPLIALTNIAELDLRNNNITDVSPLVNLVNLTELRIAGNDIADLSPLIHHPRLGARVDVVLPSVTPDIGLAAAVRDALGIDSQHRISADTLQALTTLNAARREITDLTGLEHATNLTELELYINEVSDLTPLSNLPNLTTLKLSRNAVVDVSPLSGLTNLQELHLNDNAVVDITPLAALTNLTVLKLRNNAITDVSALAALENLQTFEVGGNSLSASTLIRDAELAQAVQEALGLASPQFITIETLQDLTTLNSRYGNIVDLRGLEHATNLTELELYKNDVGYLTSLSGLTNLTVLKLSDNTVVDVSPLSGLTNLKELHLNDNHIVDVTPLAGLTNLTKLRLRNNRIENVSSLVALENLQELLLDGNPLSASTVIPDVGLAKAVQKKLGLLSWQFITEATLQELTTLDARERNISDLTGLEHATNLTELELYRNNVSDLTPLSNLPNLTALKLSRNAIVDVGPLSGLTTLEELHLNDNAVEDVTPLAALTNLSVLRLRNNAVVDAAPLIELENLRTLQLSEDTPSTSTLIPDAGLEEAVRSALHLTPTHFISVGVLKRLEQLDAPRRNISDLTGLEHATNLTELELYRNNVSDLSPLSDLPNLRVLKVSRNALELYPLAPIRNIKSLEVLHANDNNIHRLIEGASILQWLPNLTELRLRGNRVIDDDIRFLGNSTTLTILDLDGNSISDLSGLSGLTELRYLGLKDLREIGDNPIDLTPLAALENLETLRLEGTNYSRDTSPLYPLTQNNLTDVDIEISQYSPWDVNEDGQVNAIDSLTLILLVGQDSDDPRLDINGDGVVGWDDVSEVIAHWDAEAAAPSSEELLAQLDKTGFASLDPAVLEHQLDLLRAQGEGGLKYERTIALLENLLASLRPEETVLLANYPNPFNPETWLPYQLAQESDVLLIIYDVRGTVVRQLALGHQAAGYYTSQSRAAYWDGRNAIGERVSSGIYFYELRADAVSLLRKMVILK